MDNGGKPYTNEYISSNKFIRTFDNLISADELVWHRDRRDRQVKVIEGKNWKLQLDNELPKMLEYNKTYNIPKQVYHRLIKGDSNLVVEIVEL